MGNVSADEVTPMPQVAHSTRTIWPASENRSDIEF